MHRATRREFTVLYTHFCLGILTTYGTGGGKVTDHLHKRGVVAIKVGQDAVYCEGTYRGIH